jgi:holo-[acyl-carrier protein] synthase
MIVGIGTDIVEVGRIARLLKTNLHFVDKVYSAAEIAYSSAKASPAQSYAARFAAKEAFMKAIGTGWDQGVSWKEIEVINNNEGKPELVITGRSAELARAMKIRKMHLSLSHEKDYAIAYVVLEAEQTEAI